MKPTTVMNIWNPATKMNMRNPATPEHHLAHEEIAKQVILAYENNFGLGMKSNKKIFIKISYF